MQCGAAKRVRFARAVPWVILLQLAATTVAPLAHARAESTKSTRAIETTHTNQCVVIHVEARCTFNTLHFALRAAPRALYQPAPVHRTAKKRAFHRHFSTTPRFTANGVRAPPPTA